MNLTHKQKDALHGLFIHCACVHFDKIKPYYSFYSEHLDSLNVPWSLQNEIAEAAESRENVYGLYFNTVLNRILNKQGA